MFGLYGFGQPQEQEDDPVKAMVQQILSSLEPTPVPPAPQLPQMAGRGQRIAGGIGDALLAMSAVRAGGQAPQFGPFATRQMQTQNQRAMLQQKYQETLAGAQEGDRKDRNRVRTEGGLVGLRQSVKPPPRPWRPQMKTFNTVDKETKRPIDIPYLFDPNRSTLRPMPGYEGGFEQYVRPFLAQGVDEETGEAEFRLLDPFSGAGMGGGGGEQLGGPIDEGDPRYGGGGQGRLKPKTSPENVQNISDTTQLLRNIDAIKSNPLVAEGDNWEKAKRLGQEVVRAVPLVGPQSSSFLDADMEKFSGDIDNVRARVQLLLTGKAVNTQEIKRLLALIPAASTATNPKFFHDSMDRFANEFKASMLRQARLHRELFTPDELLSLGATRPGAAETDETPEQKKERFKKKYLGGVVTP
jgi:hypothetical protein